MGLVCHLSSRDGVVVEVGPGTDAVVDFAWIEYQLPLDAVVGLQGDG
jgi:hypothetical protein